MSGRVWRLCTLIVFAVVAAMSLSVLSRHDVTSGWAAQDSKQRDPNERVERFSAVRGLVSTTDIPSLLIRDVSCEGESDTLLHLTGEIRYRRDGFFLAAFDWCNPQVEPQSLSDNAFPRSSMIAGEASGMRWGGWGQSVIDVFSGKNHLSAGWGPYSVGREIRLLVANPSEAFSRLGVRGRSGESSKRTMRLYDDQFVVEHQFEPTDSPNISILMWVWYREKGRDSATVTEVAYAVRMLDEGRTLLHRVKMDDGESSSLPEIPEDFAGLRAALVEITGSSAIPVRDSRSANEG